MMSKDKSSSNRLTDWEPGTMILYKPTGEIYRVDRFITVCPDGLSEIWDYVLQCDDGYVVEVTEGRIRVEDFASFHRPADK